MLAAGEMLSLEGPNGSGKTSLLRALAGFLEPVSGFVRIRTNWGGAIDDREERGSFIGWLGHQDGVKAQMTPLETLRFFAQFPARDAGDAKERRIADALARADLARVRDLPVQYLSAGQKRRLALARLDVMERPLWLLDEPLAALDSAGKALAADYIREHCRAGGLVVAATHEPLGLEGKLLALGDAK